MIKATVICDSVNDQGNRLTTFELEYPRIIHSEFLTHRQFSRNAASSRAIPFDKMLQQLDGIPSRFGAAQSGMQDNGKEHDSYVYYDTYETYGFDDDVVFAPCKALGSARDVWEDAKESAVNFSKAFKEAGYHKQIYNRLTEPFQMIKVVVTATEYDNFFWLRDDAMADPTIAELARKMKEAYEASTPQLLKAGEWHLPYVQVDYFNTGDGIEQHFYESTSGNYSLGDYLTTEQAIKVSAARCAAVSYRNEDYGLEKCLQLYDRLVGDERKHSSALEHIATPMPENATLETNGVTSLHKILGLMSGNFAGWLQYRQFIKGECKWK